MDTNVLWGFILVLAVFGVVSVWFFWCGHAEKTRQVRAFAKRTLLYASGGFVVGLDLLNSDFGINQSGGRMGIMAITACCFLLLYAAAWAMTASDDESLEWVNLTGRTLLLTAERDLAPFYALPALQKEPATLLPPIRARTNYVVSSELAHIGAQAGRTDLFIVEATKSSNSDDSGPLLVGRLRGAVRAAAPLEESESEIRS